MRTLLLVLAALILAACAQPAGDKVRVYGIVYAGGGNSGGTVPVDTAVYEIGARATVAANTGSLTKAGCAFAGWNTSVLGAGTGYAPGDPLTVGGNVTLFAQWTAQLTLRDLGPAGGRIFFINPYSAVDGWTYLEAAPADQGTGSVWSGTSLPLVTAAGVGTGPANTAAVVAGSPGPCAARVCSDYSLVNIGVTFDDWFLPSRDEMALMLDNLTFSGTGGLAAATYWTSSQLSTMDTWTLEVANWRVFYGLTSSAFKVRAARRF